MDIRRGDVVWVDCHPSVGVEPRKTRTCVVVSNDIANRFGRAITVVATQRYSADKDARVANASMVMTYDRGRVVSRAGRVSGDAERALDRALAIHLGLTPP